MSHLQLCRRCSSARFKAPAYLAGYRLAFTRPSKKRGGGVADIVRDASAQVWGGVFILSSADAEVLDRFEGTALRPPAYRRVNVEVILHGTEASDVETYSYEVVTKEGPFRPAREYLDAIVRGATECSIPADYIADLTRIEVV